MLFMVQHTHDYSTCMAHDPAAVAAMGSIVDKAGDFGIKVHARYANRLEHTNYYVIESDSMEDIDKLFEPLLTMGHWDITPVIKK